MWQKVKKVLHYLVLPVMFIAGIVLGRSQKRSDSGSREEVDGDIRRAQELAERASDQLGKFEESVRAIGDGVGLANSDIERARELLRESTGSLDELRRAVNGYGGASRRIEEIANRYDELESESERILQELLRRAGATNFFSEKGEHNPDSADGDNLRNSGYSTDPELKENC